MNFQTTKYVLFKPCLPTGRPSRYPVVQPWDNSDTLALSNTPSFSCPEGIITRIDNKFNAIIQCEDEIRYCYPGYWDIILNWLDNLNGSDDNEPHYHCLPRGSRLHKIGPFADPHYDIMFTICYHHARVYSRGKRIRQGGENSTDLNFEKLIDKSMIDWVLWYKQTGFVDMCRDALSGDAKHFFTLLERSLDCLEESLEVEFDNRISQTKVNVVQDSA